ncbi:MAG TPA: hypothetical protein VF743_09370, partial [Acidimicrobiales bacterium]
MSEKSTGGKGSPDADDGYGDAYDDSPAIDPRPFVDGSPFVDAPPSVSDAVVASGPAPTMEVPPAPTPAPRPDAGAVPA